MGNMEYSITRPWPHVGPSHTSCLWGNTKQSLGGDPQIDLRSEPCGSPPSHVFSQEQLLHRMSHAWQVFFLFNVNRAAAPDICDRESCQVTLMILCGRQKTKPQQNQFVPTRSYSEKPRCSWLINIALTLWLLFLHSFMIQAFSPHPFQTVCEHQRWLFCKPTHLHCEPQDWIFITHSSCYFIFLPVSLLTSAGSVVSTCSMIPLTSMWMWMQLLASASCTVLCQHLHKSPHSEDLSYETV